MGSSVGLPILVPPLHIVEMKEVHGGARTIAVECSCGWRTLADDWRHHDHKREARILALEHRIDVLEGKKTPPDEDLEKSLRSRRSYSWPFPAHPGDFEYEAPVDRDPKPVVKRAVQEPVFEPDEPSL